MIPRPLKATLACLLLVTAVNSGRAQPPPITLSFSTPASNQPLDSSFSVQVNCASQTAYAITSVIANLQGRSTVLTNIAQWLYSGIVSLAGLPKDSVYTLTVIAKNANGDSAVISEPVIYDPPPALTLIKPYQGAVGRPTIDVKATCAATAGHCQIAVEIINGTTHIPVGTFADSVDTAVDVSAYEGSPNMQLQATGTDQHNAQSLKARIFYVETSPYLTPLYTANNPIDGLWRNNVLVADLLVADSPRIANYATGGVTTVPYRGLIPYTGGAFLSSQGMFFQAQPVNQAGGPAGYPSFYDWNNGSLDSLGWRFADKLQVSGNFATWIDGGTALFLRNLTTKTTQLIDPKVENVYNLDTSGAIAYTHNGVNLDSLFLYKSGVSTPVRVRALDTLLLSPLTDGKNVVYIQQDGSFNKTIYRYDAKSGTNMFLSSLGNTSEHPDLNTATAFRVSDGYTAYVKLDGNSRYQAWVRDTAGNSTQASFFTWSSNLERLAPNGQLAFLNGAATPYGLRHIYDKAAGVTAISSQLGTSYYQDTSWYLSIGNTLFGVNLHISPDKADSFAIKVKNDSLYTFSVNDLASHYETNGSLMAVVISKLPSHGTLKLNGVSVTVSQEIPRAGLQKLVYTPAAGFIGSDTVVWNGSNGYTSSPSTALLVINVGVVMPAPPPAPQISGLQTTYCPTAGPQNIKVTNVPAASYQVTVVVKVDGAVTNVGSDNSFQLRPDTLASGQHTVIVVFKNTTAADTGSWSFNVLQKVIPDVQLDANIVNVTDLNQQVVLTATNVSGGGATPLYTFAKDRNFSTIVQAEGTSATYSFNPSTLSVGSNSLYVQMRTSGSCFSVQTAVDSIVIVRSTVTGIVDVDYPDQVINISSNPFLDHLHITGLQSFKKYALSLVRSNGQVVLRQQATGQQEVNIQTGLVAAGVYLLNIYDVEKGRLIGTVKLLSLGK